ncbi:MAG TPA: MerR family transcriptional regulator [Pseudonocardia sp.]|uniref:MerR family transcriptional regulator n=1 Tax=Pseudonocardia sp. TaxID=60912 RepID=UPI002B4AE97B|nr:MerR family transcriptional regulator [Pseudonocardia sp.]HLU56314.1 MerR family transcriptional regulator [Pseudonocardia sp.]
MKSRGEMTIGELADRFGLATHVLRHWEAVGLLAPARRVNGRRRYGPEALARVAIILQCKELGFGLEQVRELLHAGDPATRKEVLARHDADLERRIAIATAAREMIAHGLNCPAPDLLECPNFLAGIEARIPPARAR